VGSFEIIVADALSNDGTREILARLAAEHACLRLVDDPGRSVPMGLNTAIRAARVGSLSASTPTRSTPPIMSANA
jgi:glycosyltransferase involved in cell wall biosynthesis